MFVAFKPVARLFGLVTMLVAGTSAAAQVDHPGRAFGELLPPVVDLVQVAPPDVVALLAEDQARGDLPLRYGVPIATRIGIATHGQWDTAPDGTLIWRVAIAASGSKSIGLEFSAFRLPNGAKLFAYSPDFQTVFGAFSAANHNPDGEFAIRPLPGESIVLELQIPDAVGEVPDLIVDHLIYDYRDVFQMLATSAGSGAAEGGCSVGVNCPAGAPYPELKRATVRTLNGGVLCSGVLLNNTSNDGTRYLYTANHCGTGSNVVVTFNYQQSGCGSGSAPTNQTVSGATLLANNTISDGRLLRINNTIPASYNPYYMGWSRSTASLTLGVSMHHPGGFAKSVSIDSNGGGQSTQGFIGIGSVQVWNMNFQTGGTEGGSSGGPLIDQNDRVRGVLTGGPASCQISYYGRFHNFWNNTNIAQFLDPGGSGVTNLDGFDPSGSTGGGCAVTLYGQGLGGANTGTLTSASIPALGNTVTFSYSNFPPNLTGIVILTTQQDAAPILGGTVLVNLQTQVFNLPAQTNGAGAGSTDFVIAPTAPWVGLTGYGQVGLIHPAAPAGWAFSNGIAFTFCAG